VPDHGEDIALSALTVGAESHPVGTDDFPLLGSRALGVRRDALCSVNAVAKGWLEAQTLRQSVLGWPAGPAAGDTGALTRHLFVVDAAGESIGVVSFTPHPCPSRPGIRATYLWGMAVRSDAQRVGHGTRLAKAVLEDARETGAALVWADARLTAVQFYQRLGAVPEGPTCIDDVTGLTDQRVLFDLSNGSDKA